MTCVDCGREMAIIAKGLCGACYHRARYKNGMPRTNAQNKGKTCSHKGCQQKARAKGFCHYHYERQMHPLIPQWKVLRSRHPGQYPEAWKRFSEFLADVGEKPSERHKLRRIDPSLPWSKDNARWQSPIGKNKDGMTRTERTAYAHAWNLRQSFNLTPEQFEAMLTQQSGGCAICGGKGPPDKHGNPRRLSVDHCHSTGKIRGLLCVNCNRGIGYFSDRIDLLEAAIAYLRLNGVASSP